MAKTLKDKHERYIAPEELPFRNKPTANLSRRYTNFKTHGPTAHDEMCPDCGGYLESHSGYLTCVECGYSEDWIQFMERGAA